MSSLADLGVIIPDWPAPPWVRACSTTRQGGCSLPPYGSLNLAEHVGDALVAVAGNRQRLIQSLALPATPVWLEQVHGVRVINAEGDVQGGADAAYAGKSGVVCAVLTADCLPIVLCDRAGTRVAAIHAGWRGLATGVVEAALVAIQRPACEIMAWLGPAIGPQAFEVGNEVREVFVHHDSRAASAFCAFQGRWLADICQLARHRLSARGVEHIYGGQWCTFSDAGRFFSYRRDGETGRMATLIWMNDT